MESAKVSVLLGAVADDASLELFKLIAGASASSEVLRSRITRASSTIPGCTG